MNQEFKERLIDYFDAFDLVDLLNITTRQIVDAFTDEIEDAEEWLDDYMRDGD